jgi:hypothetical protein
MHARRTCAHAGKAREASVDMLNRLFIGGAPLLHHLLDKIDPTARTIQFISQKLVCRTCRRTKTAMNTAAQNFIRLADICVLQLRFREICLHDVIVP